jgi:hypothetical protein
MEPNVAVSTPPTMPEGLPPLFGFVAKELSYEAAPHAPAEG